MLWIFFAKSNICANLYWLFIFSWVEEKYSRNYFSVALNFPSIFVENWLSKFSNSEFCSTPEGYCCCFLCICFVLFVFLFNDLPGVNLWKLSLPCSVGTDVSAQYFFSLFSLVSQETSWLHSSWPMLDQKIYPNILS